MSIIVGPHVNRVHAQGKRPSIIDHIEVARKEALNDSGIKIKVVAIFVGGPKTNLITLSVDERISLREYIQITNIKVIAHSTYSAYPWTGNLDAASFIREELSVCQEAGITGLVVHLPKLPIENVIKYIKGIININAVNVRIYLETPAVNPTESYYETPAKLNSLFQEIRIIDPNLLIFGLCIDSAHLWTCGIDLQSFEAAESWFHGLESISDIIPPDVIMIHLNDSKRLIGVGPDTHEGLAVGKIWGDYKDNLENSGLFAIINYAVRNCTLVILERKPKENLKNDYLIIRKLTFV